MARPRNKKAEHFPIPESYLGENDEESLPPGFQEAFNHARACGNNDKASLIFAENHAANFVPEDGKEED